MSRRGLSAERMRILRTSLDIAKGSADEVGSMLYLAEDRRFVQSDDRLRLRSEASALSRGIAQLAKYLRRDRSK